MARRTAEKRIVDPLAYIEQAFLDKAQLGNSLLNEKKKPKKKLTKTSLNAPRPRLTKENLESPQQIKLAVPTEVQETWSFLPKAVELLSTLYDDEVTQNYYRSGFKESRKELIERLLDPPLTLEETSRLLGVCPATVRRYTNRGWLEHYRTEGRQRRFKLSQILKFIEKHGRFPVE